MSVGIRYIVPYATALDAEGVSLPGAKLYFYESGTATPLGTYSDVGLTVPNTNPVISDAGGLFGNIFLQPEDYKVILTDANGAQLWVADPVAGIFGGVASIASIATVADLRAFGVTQSMVGSVVYVRGYATDSDGGEGFFLITDINPGADNGGTIIYSNIAGFYYVRSYSGALDARWFGCVGSINCATALGNAIAASAGETLLIVGDHTYNVSSGPTSLVSNINIVGLGNPTINNTYDGVMWAIPNSTHDITVSGITFSGVAKQHIGTNGNSGANNLRFYNSNFTGCTLATATSVYLTPMLLDTVDHVWIDNCQFYGNGRGPDASADNNDLMLGYNGGINHHIWITNSSFTSTQVIGNIFGYNTNYFWVENCFCSGAQTFTGFGAGGYGILSYNASIPDSRFINFHNNTITNTGGSGIYVTGGLYVNITGNILDTNCITQLDVSLPSAAISLNGPTNFTVASNTISNSNENGITIAGNLGPGSVTGNFIYNSTSNQIHLRGMCSVISVTGNVCSNGHANDIEITAGANLTISGNTLTSGGRVSASINAILINYSTIDSNSINGAFKYGIAVQAGTSLTINGNSVIDSSTLTDNTYDGISNSATKTLISNNYAGNSGGTGTRYGIISGADYCTISNNLCLSNRTAGLILSGTNIDRFGNRVSTDPISGSAVLTAGTNTISTAEVQTGDLINLTCTGAGGTQGIIRVSAITASTSFVLTSSQAGDTSTYQWQIVH